MLPDSYFSHRSRCRQSTVFHARFLIYLVPLMKRIVILIVLLVIVTGCGPDVGEQAGPATPAPTRTATPEISVTLVTRAPPTMAVIQTTPTPLSTATPTATPTPIQYAVVEGDTLLGIAIDNLTTVEQIEELNPGVVPELLQIGQSLVLPPPATPVFSGTAATAVPLQVEVRTIQLVRTPVGSMWLLGEVVNNGEYPVSGIQVQIDLMGPEGSSLLAAPAWVAAGVVRPGERAPFATLVREPPTEQVQPVVAVIRGDTLLEQGSFYLDLAASTSDVNIEDGQANVAGTIENVGQEAASALTVIATFYGAQDQVTGYAQKVLEDPVAPGESAPYALGGAPPGGPTVEVAVTVYGLTQ